MHGLSVASYDLPWGDVGPSVWSNVEISIAILGACAITYRPLFSWIYQNWILKIKSSVSRAEGRASGVASIKVPVDNTEKDVKSESRTHITMHSPSASHSSVPPSIYSPH